MNQIDWNEVRLNVSILLKAVGLLEDLFTTTEIIVSSLQVTVEYGGLLTKQDRRELAELLPQTSKLWPESSDVSEFIKNIELEAERTSKLLEAAKSYTIAPEQICKSVVYKTYDLADLIFSFGIGAGFGTILTTIFHTLRF